MNVHCSLARGLTALTLAFANLAPAAFAGPLHTRTAQVAKLAAEDAAANDTFGVAVSISGDTAVVGAHLDDDNGTDSGSAYVFVRNHPTADAWGQIAKLTADDGAMDDFFGVSLSIDGDTIVVGAYGEDDNGSNAGAAYVFERDQGGTDQWGQVAKLTAEDAAEGDNFGLAVSISGNTIVIGAFGDDDTASGSGSAYVFERDHPTAGAWGQRRKLTASDPAQDDAFGAAVAIHADTIAVGAHLRDGAATDSGAAYVFGRNQDGADVWGEVTIITPDDPAQDDQFGLAVSISSDSLVAGAYRDDDGGSLSGSAYVFERNQPSADGWGQTAKLAASDPAADKWFGIDVSIDGDVAVVGACFDNEGGGGSGAAYEFSRDQNGPGQWGFVAKLKAIDAAGGDQFGLDVDVSGDFATAGARLDDDAGNTSGSAYVFDRRVIPPTPTPSSTPTITPTITSTPTITPTGNPTATPTTPGPVPAEGTGGLVLLILALTAALLAAARRYIPTPV